MYSLGHSMEVFRRFAFAGWKKKYLEVARNTIFVVLGIHFQSAHTPTSPRISIFVVLYSMFPSLLPFPSPPLPLPPPPHIQPKAYSHSHLVYNPLKCCYNVLCFLALLANSISGLFLLGVQNIKISQQVQKLFQKG